MASNIYSHQNEKDVSLPMEEKLKFDGINSQRIKLGTKFDYLINKRSIPNIYARVALNHEFDGEVKVVVDNISAINSGLKGSCVEGELGLTKNIGQFNLELGMQGYAGNKDGISGNLKVVYTFKM
jgi:outer membrane autotransporter protein